MFDKKISFVKEGEGVEEKVRGKKKPP